MIILVQTIIMNTCGTVGFIANSLVIAVLVKFTSFQEKPSMQFILMQSVIDALASLGIIFCDRNFGFNLKLVEIKYHDNVFGNALCYLWGGNMFMASMFLVSTFNLVILTMERYFKILYPFRYMKSFRKWKLRVALFLPWVMGFVHKMAVHLPQYSIRDQQCVSSPKDFSKKFLIFKSIWDLSVTFLIPIIIMAICYIRIFLTLQESSRKFRKSPTEGEGEEKANTTRTMSVLSENSTKISSISLPSDVDGAPASATAPSVNDMKDSEVTQDISGRPKGKTSGHTSGPSSQNSQHEVKISKSEKKVLKTLVVVTVGFFICWVGRQTIFFLLNVLGSFDFYFVIDDLVITLAFLNSVINPFIYVITLTEYRQIFWKKLRGE